MAKKKTEFDQPPPEDDSAGGASEPRPDFEETLAEIETVVRKLEAGELTLDESLEHYESAVGKMRQCYRLLEVAERRICVLAGFDADGNPITETLEDAGAGQGNDAQTLLEKQKTRGQRRGAAPSGRIPSSGLGSDDGERADGEGSDTENEDWT